MLKMGTKLKLVLTLNHIDELLDFAEQRYQNQGNANQQDLSWERVVMQTKASDHVCPTCEESHSLYQVPH